MVAETSTSLSSQFKPARLTIARQRRHLTRTDLAHKLKVTPRTITRWEHGEVQPSDENLESLAQELTFPVEFFRRPEPREVPIPAVSFRALSKTPAGLRDAALASARVALDVDRWISARFLTPSVDIPSLVDYEPEHAASIVRERWGLGTQPIKNLLHVLESRGVRVFSLAVDAQAVDAFSFIVDDTPFILLNTRKTAERQRFDLAHELGHLVLHCEYSETQGKKKESQAQMFAAALLMPAADVLGQPFGVITVDVILRAKRRWGVAAMALSHRLHELQLLTDWGYRDICIALSGAGYRRAEPERAITPETSQLLRKVLASIRSTGGSVRTIAESLALEEQELIKMVFGLMPAALAGGQEGDRRSRIDRPKLKVVK
jgi:Zn-dependent peptidase ImmA (M78 family)/DNA-binding XRE family transcriptional regulator